VKHNAPSFEFPDGAKMSVDYILDSSTVNPDSKELYITFTIEENHIATVYLFQILRPVWRSFSSNKTDHALRDYLRRHLDKASFLHRFHLKEK
jgi:hypothetical protein